MQQKGNNFGSRIANHLKQAHSHLKRTLFRQARINYSEAQEHEMLKCPACGAVFYKKGWRRTAPEGVSAAQAKSELCPADAMKQRNEYEGKVTVVNMPAEYKQELLNLVQNMSEHAMEQDATHRVLSAEDHDTTIEIFTSENQLAQKIARKIMDAHKNAFEQRISNRGAGVDTIDVELYWTKLS